MRSGSTDLPVLKPYRAPAPIAPSGFAAPMMLGGGTLTVFVILFGASLALAQVTARPAGEGAATVLLRWAPLFVLAFVGLWWLWRSRRDRLVRAVSGLHRIELTVGLCATVLGVQLVVAVLLAPTADTVPFAARHLIPALPLAVPLVAVGLRRLPGVGVGLIVL